MRPLFDSFNKCVHTKTLDDFLNSLWQWVDQHCTLPILRPVVLECLTKLSMNTSVLEDPACLNVLATSSLRNQDPTLLVSTNQNSSSRSTTFSSPSWDDVSWQ